nr:Tn3 family transposase [Clostridium ljungdahlii]
MIQQVLSKDKWENTLTTEDLRALTPLIYNHINPYGNFELNMDERIPILK